VASAQIILVLERLNFHKFFFEEQSFVKENEESFQIYSENHP
jgi:hypothetical protein